ncbi:hypothetical protein DOS68_06810 [Staphylococcus felis]|nr:hypothetical protein DOS68_06810 [Staphylococcus felis]
MRELENQMVELENQHDIVLLKSLGRYFIDIENNGENYFNIEYVLLNKVEYTNANVYFEIEIHRIKEVPFMDVVTEDNIDEFEMKWFDLDQSTETYIESVFFENEEDAKSYINFVLKGYKTFKAVAKAIGLIE